MSIKFSGHQSFVFRHTWLTKGVTACAADRDLFRLPDALVILGVGKNMVESIRYWCLATRVIEPHREERFGHQPSPIGKAIFLRDGGWDPYLEDEGTLWLLHHLLATNPAVASTISFAFNEWPGHDFAAAGLYAAMARQAEKAQAQVSPNTLKRDVNVFVRSYVGAGAASSLEDTLDCPLVDLKLIYEEPLRQTYAFARGPKDTLPDAVFYYALADYASRQEDRRSFTFDELAYFPFSPGRVFKLDEAALAERLERMADLTAGAWQMVETAGFRQMIVRRVVDPFAVLQDYYQLRRGENADGRD